MAAAVAKPSNALQLRAHMRFEEKYILPLIKPAAADRIRRDHRRFRKILDAGGWPKRERMQGHEEYEKVVFTQPA